MRQGRKLASVYDVPFMELLSKDKPKIKELELVPDFRMHSGAEAPTELHELLMIQAEAEETRALRASKLELRTSNRQLSTPYRQFADEPVFVDTAQFRKLGYFGQCQL